MEIKEKVARLLEHANTETTREMLVDTFAHLYSANPRLAEELAETFDGNLNYNNYLTESEAQRILATMLNEDGTHGAIWSAKDYFAKAESLGYAIDNAPSYNRWALYVTACHEVSDHLSVLAKWANKDVTKYVEFATDLAITQLNDRDKQKWVRWYFAV